MCKRKRLYVRERLSVYVRERKRLSVYVRERKRLSVFVREREREREIECVCKKERD